MASSGNRRRPRSGAPERLDLKDKAGKIHAEIFGHQDDNSPENKPGHWMMRIAAGFAVAMLCWLLSVLLNNEYLLLFAISMAIGMVMIFVFRLFTRRRK